MGGALPRPAGARDPPRRWGQRPGRRAAGGADAGRGYKIWINEISQLLMIHTTVTHF